MKRLTILIPRTKPPDVHDIFTTILNNVLTHLRESYELKIFWVMFQPGIVDQKTTKEITILDFKNYGNGVDILNETKPDLIIVEGSLDFLNVIFALAGKNKKIPVSTFFFRWNIFENKPTKLFTIKSRLRIIFSKRVAADYSLEKHSSQFRALKFFLQKYRFLHNSLKQIRYGPFQILNFLIHYTMHVMAYY